MYVKKGYAAWGKKKRAAYLDCMDMLYGDCHDEQKDEARERKEHRDAIIFGKPEGDYQKDK